MVFFSEHFSYRMNAGEYEDIFVEWMEGRRKDTWTSVTGWGNLLSVSFLLSSRFLIYFNTTYIHVLRHTVSDTLPDLDTVSYHTILYVLT